MTAVYQHAEMSQQGARLRYNRASGSDGELERTDHGAEPLLVRVGAALLTTTPDATTPEIWDGRVSWDEEYGPIWRCACGAYNPLIVSDRNWLEHCPACQKDRAPNRWRVEQLLGRKGDGKGLWLDSC